MGAYTCQFGFVHKMCRCPTPHTIRCDKVSEHAPKEKPLEDAVCLIWWNVHEPHDWWYTDEGGGHMVTIPDKTKDKEWHCPGVDYVPTHRGIPPHPYIGAKTPWDYKPTHRRNSA